MAKSRCAIKTMMWAWTVGLRGLIAIPAAFRFFLTLGFLPAATAEEVKSVREKVQTSLDEVEQKVVYFQDSLRNLDNQWWDVTDSRGPVASAVRAHEDIEFLMDGKRDLLKLWQSRQQLMTAVAASHWLPYPTH